MRILFLTDNFPPEVNAPATRTLEHCREWVAAGAEVTVVTCVPNFPMGVVLPGYRNWLYQTEEVEGIRVVRVWTYIAANTGFLKRIIDYLSFAVSSTVAGLFQHFDVIVATSPQFFTACAGAALSRLRQRPWVFELRDLWPESIVATGTMTPGYATEVLERLELALYRDAEEVVAVTDAFREDLMRRGITGEKISVVPNGVLPGVFTTSSRPRDPECPFVVGYVGTHGLAHGLETVLDAAALLRDDPVRFLLVGDGASKANLVEEATARGLTNVEFRPPVPRTGLPGVFEEIDVAVVPLRRSPTFETVIPSKIFEAAAAGRPILLGVSGQARRIVDRYSAGVWFDPGNGEALAAAVKNLAADEEALDGLKRGCTKLADDYDRRALAARMLARLRVVAERPLYGN